MPKKTAKADLEFGPTGKSAADDYATSWLVVLLQNNSILYRPWFWLSLSLIFYTIFESLNATVVCRNGTVTFITGLFSFLGFWTLVASIVTQVKLTRSTRKFSWAWVIITLFIVALFMFDAYLAKTCFYN